ncbi:hypothetical protein HN789_04585 [archaeon]|jgi:hypothetical protein|nr:hypothetical protein [archaeon]MBT4022453.1 hypothetical protein [archaeon]MBT4272608.1 hypothetical protein [archaeon]MBT4461226.1 hypothetical protein [archaeon]MBT4858260.1 hypothetical protein [archaeon]
MIRAKKAELITARVLVEIIIFVVVFVIIIKGSATLWKLYVTKPQTVTENSFVLLHKHIKYFDAETSDTFPLQVDNKHIIKGYDKEDPSKPDLCEEGSCLCINLANGNVLRCKQIESSINEDIRLSSSFEINPSEDVQNFYLEKDSKTSQISIHNG